MSGCWHKRWNCRSNCWPRLFAWASRLIGTAITPSSMRCGCGHANRPKASASNKAKTTAPCSRNRRRGEKVRRRVRSKTSSSWTRKRWRPYWNMAGHFRAISTLTSSAPSRSKCSRPSPKRFHMAITCWSKPEPALENA